MRKQHFISLVLSFSFVMRIVAATVQSIKLPFRFSFKHALATRVANDSVLLKITTDRGVDGWGEALPRQYLTGETVATVNADVQNRWLPRAREIDFSVNTNGGAAVLAELFALYAQADAERKTAGYTALELAILDAAAKTARQPINDFLGLAKNPVKLTAPLGGGGARKLRWLTTAFRWLGFTEFKLKVGLRGEFDADWRRLRAVREIIGDERKFDLRIDANAAWDVKTAVALIEKFAPFKLSSIEQPAVTIAELAAIKKSTGAVIMADEALCTRADAREIIAQNAATMWNLRLAKNGGFNGVFALMKMAQEYNASIATASTAENVGEKISFHLGALVGETGLLTAAARALAGSGLFRHVEYGFPRILLKNDPFRGAPAGYFGLGKPLKNLDGFGVRKINE